MRELLRREGYRRTDANGGSRSGEIAHYTNPLNAAMIIESRDFLTPHYVVFNFVSPKRDKLLAVTINSTFPERMNAEAD